MRQKWVGIRVIIRRVARRPGGGKLERAASGHCCPTSFRTGDWLVGWREGEKVLGWLAISTGGVVSETGRSRCKQGEELR